MGFYIALRAILYSILQAALIVALGYLLAAELSPPPAFASTEPVLIVVLPMALSVLTTLAIFPASFFDKLNATHCIAFLNLFPVLLWIVTASKSLLSSSCWRAMAQNGESCQRWTGERAEMFTVSSAYNRLNPLLHFDSACHNTTPQSSSTPFPS